jgi:hypothetical protein
LLSSEACLKIEKLDLKHEKIVNVVKIIQNVHFFKTPLKFENSSGNSGVDLVPISVILNGTFFVHISYKIIPKDLKL